MQSQTESVGDKYPLFDQLLGRHEGGYDDFNTPKGSKYATHRGEEIADGKKLSDLTVGEVMQMQKNGKLFAAGHYQITPPAMKDALRLSGVSPDEKFSPEIQDKLFEDGLLKKAGAGRLYDYITGKSDDIDKAMLATAQEWAAFPVPHDMHITDQKFGDRDLKAGDSYYEGVKGNHSNMSLEDAKAAIEEMRANYLASHSADNQTAENAQSETHSPNNQATQTADNAVKSSKVVSGSLNALPINHLPNGVHRISVKNLDEEKPIPCGANNPYKYDTVPYWVQEWAGRARTWQEAHEIAYPAKMKPGTDAQTAAEHYTFARAVQSDPNYNVAHSTTKCDSFENDLTRRDDSQDLGQNARDLSRDIAVDEKLNPQTSAWLGSNYEEYKKLDEQGLVDKPNVGLTGNHQADNQPQETAIPAENQVSGSLNGEKYSEVADKDAHKEPQNEQEKPAKPHKARQAEHLSQENHHQNQGNHKKTQPTTPKSDTINGVSGSVNKLPTDHLPKGVRRVSVKEIYSTKLCSTYNPLEDIDIAEVSVPCGANNPYKYNTPEYWIWEWTGHANGWEKAFEIARQGKMCQWNDAKTAAEHYIVAQRLQNDPDKSELEKIAHRTFLPVYGLVYEGAWKGVPHLLHKVGIKKDSPTTSNPSYQQLQYHFKGWWDGLPDNFNKNIDVKFGVCVPKKDKK